MRGLNALLIVYFGLVANIFVSEAFAQHQFVDNENGSPVESSFEGPPTEEMLREMCILRARSAHTACYINVYDLCEDFDLTWPACQRMLRNCDEIFSTSISACNAGS